MSPHTCREHWDYSTEGDLGQGVQLSPRPKPRPPRRKDWEKVPPGLCAVGSSCPTALPTLRMCWMQLWSFPAMLCAVFSLVMVYIVVMVHLLGLQDAPRAPSVSARKVGTPQTATYSSI